MVETRIATRHRVLKAGTIEFGNNAINCVIRDLSITGAALEVPNQTGIPAQFTLLVPGDGLRLRCTVVRRGGYPRSLPHPTRGYDFELQTFSCRVCHHEIERNADLLSEGLVRPHPADAFANDIER